MVYLKKQKEKTQQFTQTPITCGSIRYKYGSKEEHIVNMILTNKGQINGRFD